MVPTTYQELVLQSLGQYKEYRERVKQEAEEQVGGGEEQIQIQTQMQIQIQQNHHKHNSGEEEHHQRPLCQERHLPALLPQGP